MASKLVCKEDGVTLGFDKPSSRATHVFFTLNNPTALLDYPTLEKQGVTFLIYQKEKGDEEGTPHFQGVFSLKSQQRLSALKKLPGLEKAHFERVKHFGKAVNYCKKEATRIEGPWEHGTCQGRGQGHRADLDDIQARLNNREPLLEIAQDNFQQFLQYGKRWEHFIDLQMKVRSTPPTVLLFVGPSGTGKTRTAMAIAEAYGTVYKAPAPKGSGWYCDGYAQQDVFIIDEMDGNVMTPTRFNLLCDRYPEQISYHGGQRQFNSPLIIITSNYLPKSWWKNRNDAQVTQTTRRIHATWFFGSHSRDNLGNMFGTPEYDPENIPEKNIKFQNQHGLVGYVPFRRVLDSSEPQKKKTKN